MGKRLFLIGFLILLLFPSMAQAESARDLVRLKVDWNEDVDRYWAGRQFWANRLQDWRVKDNRLECIHQGRGRNVQLLTYQLTPDSNAKLSAVVDRPDPSIDGWVGFRYAIQGRVDDYRHNAIHGKSSYEARLFNGGGVNLDDAWKKIGNERKVRLELEFDKRSGDHRVVFRVKSLGDDILAEVEGMMDSSRLVGNVALMCYSNEENKQTHGSLVAAYDDFELMGTGLAGGVEQNWGPILWTQYTVDEGVLKLTAQFPPLGEADNKQAVLETNQGSGWSQVASAVIDDQARVALFSVPKWSESKPASYRVVYHLGNRRFTHQGFIRKNPIDSDEISVAAFTGNKDYGFPNTQIVENVKALNPDLLFFSGDQIYESVAGYSITRSPLEEATLDYLRKWYLFGWSFKDVLKNRPTVIIPDDHDVYQGNLWGQEGRRIPAGESFEYGGYVMPVDWVNLVQRTQTGHLPDPYNAGLVGQGLHTYYTDLKWGGISFAILEDRKFKSGPKGFKGKLDNPAGAVLLGDEQEDFLEEWAGDMKDVTMKAVLSQTVFAQVHTHTADESGSKKPSRKVADSNGWPPAGRNQALEIIRKGYGFMIAGDNHLATVVHHGVDTWEDAGVSFSLPSIASGFPRAWFPVDANKKKFDGMPDYTESWKSSDLPEYVGRYLSDWKHPITMLAAANPSDMVHDGKTVPGDLEMLQRKMSGFGLVRFNTKNRLITIECYPILSKIANGHGEQCEGWPITVHQSTGYQKKIVGHLPEIKVDSGEEPALKVYKQTQAGLELVYAVRLWNDSVRPWVFEDGVYTVELGYPETNDWERMEGVRPKMIEGFRSDSDLDGDVDFIDYALIVEGYEEAAFKTEVVRSIFDISGLQSVFAKRLN